MAEINSNMAYYPPNPSAQKKKTLGLAVAGGLIGMNAYYIPVKKDVFIQRAFDVTRDEATSQILALKTAAKEVTENKITPESKMILQEMGLSEDFQQITDKCIELDKKVSDPANVKRLKADFASNFANYKKDVSLMDNNCAKAFKLIKRNKFMWGAGIGAAIGVALSFIFGRN